MSWSCALLTLKGEDDSSIGSIGFNLGKMNNKTEEKTPEPEVVADKFEDDVSIGISWEKKNTDGEKSEEVKDDKVAESIEENENDKVEEEKEVPNQNSVRTVRRKVYPNYRYYYPWMIYPYYPYRYKKNNPR